MYKVTKNQKANIEYLMVHADYDPGRLVFGYELYPMSTNIYGCVIGDIHACVVSRCSTRISKEKVQERIDAFMAYSLIVIPVPPAVNNYQKRS